MAPYHADNHCQNTYTICNNITFEAKMFVTHLHDHIHVGAEDPCRACVVATEVSKEHVTSCSKTDRNIEDSSLFVCYTMLTGKQLPLL
jgi:ferredoxin-thioredoxin reductase catalytic subunit